MKIYPTSNHSLIHNLLCDERLLKAAGYNKTSKNFKVDTSYNYLLIEDYAKLLGCFQIRQITNKVIECHINILPEYWGKENISYQASLLGFEYLRKNTNYNKAYTDVPSNCENVKNLCSKLGWKICGLIKDGVIYNHQLCDLLLYDFNLRD